MKSKTMALLAVAVVCGLAASYMTSRLLADRNEKVAIVVAKQKFGSWSPIKNAEEQFEFQERVKSEIPKNAVTSLDSLKDHIVVKGLDKGEPVVTDNLMSRDKGGMEVIITPGKRAMGVRTTAEKVVGGFVLPGSRVDVIHTIRANGEKAGSKVILQNILVRAVDQQAMKPDDRPAMVPTTVTLELTLQQALILAEHQDVGSLTFALRPFGDEKVEATELPPPPKPFVPPPPPPVRVAVKAPDAPPPEPKRPVIKEAPIDRKTLVIQNGSGWIRATYTTQNGQTQTTVERTQPDFAPSNGAAGQPEAPAFNPRDLGPGGKRSGSR